MHQRLVLVLLCLLPVAALLLLFQGSRDESIREPFAPTADLRGLLPVFPGAEGFGTDTPAGRGGSVLRVTTLADEGPGSLREALATSGARTVVFEVGGIIRMRRDLAITEPFVTVAGQTAPHPGITLAGAGVAILTHDVLVQHLRIRVGDDPDGPDPNGRDGIAVHQGGRRVVIDHCSIAWAVDEGTSTWGTDIREVTFSHCIIAENLSRSIHPKGEHSKGLLIGDHSRQIAVLGNLFAHNQRRNPLVKGDASALIANNLIYNPGSDAIRWSDPEHSGPARATVLNNAWIPGPDTGRFVSFLSRDIRLSQGTRIHASGNRVLRNQDWYDAPLGAFMAPLMLTAPPVELAPLTLLSAEAVPEAVLTAAGAWPAARDRVDQRIIASVRERTGDIIDTPAAVGGLPAVPPTHRPLTLPDDPNSDTDGNGYTRLEEWLHAMAARAEGREPNPRRGSP